MAEPVKHTCNPEQWVTAYSDEFFRFAMFRVKKREVAEDLVQDTFLSGLGALPRFRGDCTEKSWLYNILRNKIIDHFRKKVNQEIKKSDALSDMDDETFFSFFFHKDGSKLGEWKEDVSPKKWELAADSIMEKEEFMEILHYCLARLPEVQSKVFSLKNIEEFTTKEICKELGLTASNLWTIIHRAKLQLRGCLENRWLKE